MKAGTALIVIDVQNDFCEGGVLAASNTKSLIEPLNKFITRAAGQKFFFVFSRDWHPPDHCSFIPQGGIWPPHCVQETYGAKIARGLYFPDSSLFIDIETDPAQSNVSYSSFENTPLLGELNRLNIQFVVIAGIATEYCVKATALDAVQHGFSVTVMKDLVRPINMNPGDDQRAISEMEKAGVQLITSMEWMKSF